jgi:hypothetical protein
MYEGFRETNQIENDGWIEKYSNKYDRSFWKNELTGEKSWHSPYYQRPITLSVGKGHHPESDIEREGERDKGTKKGKEGIRSNGKAGRRFRGDSNEEEKDILKDRGLSEHFYDQNAIRLNNSNQNYSGNSSDNRYQDNWTNNDIKDDDDVNGIMKNMSDKPLVNINKNDININKKDINSKKGAIESEWESHISRKHNRIYYRNKLTNETTWSIHIKSPGSTVPERTILGNTHCKSWITQEQISTTMFIWLKICIHIDVCMYYVCIYMHINTLTYACIYIYVYIYAYIYIYMYVYRYLHV